MADRIVVMDNGYLAQVGTAYEIYQQPNSAFVADFIGVMNFMPGQVTATDQIRCGDIYFQAPRNDIPINQNAFLAIRPEDVRVLGDNASNGLPNVLTTVVEGLEFLGSSYQLSLHPADIIEQPIWVEISAAEALQFDLSIQSRLSIQLPPEKIRVFAAENQ